MLLEAQESFGTWLTHKYPGIRSDSDLCGFHLNVLGDIAFDKKGDLTSDGYIVNGKKMERYVLYIWRKGPDGRITYFEAE